MAKSKYWDPSWRKPTYRVRHYRPTPEMTQHMLAEAEAQGWILGEAPDVTTCFAPDGFARVAIVGPDYDVLVSAIDREEAAPLQKEVGRLTWYFLCTRPHVRAVPDGVRIEADELVLPFEMLLDDGTVNAYEWRQPRPDWLESVRTEAGGRFIVYDHTNGTTFPHEAALLVQGHLPEARAGLGSENFDLRVHYIGRARGKTHETCALDRLVSHEKYQAVIEEVHASEYRNRDVWLVLASGTTMNLFVAHDDTVDEVTPAVEARMAQEDERAREILTESDRVDLVEALLINHFKPPLNIQHKDKLGLQNKVLVQCRLAKITGVAMVYVSRNLGVSLYTDTTGRHLQHSMIVPLV